VLISANSTAHGGYDTSGVAISDGAFAEDPGQVEAFLEGVIDSLSPCCPLVQTPERDVGVGFLGSMRRVRLETSLVEKVSQSTHQSYNSHAEPITEFERSIERAEALVRWLTNTSTGLTRAGPGENVGENPGWVECRGGGAGGQFPFLPV
jgi:hypothetical protein